LFHLLIAAEGDRAYLREGAIDCDDDLSAVSILSVDKVAPLANEFLGRRLDGFFGLSIRGESGQKDDEGHKIFIVHLNNYIYSVFEVNISVFKCIAGAIGPASFL
jgi:hypothetical protein